MSGPSADLLAWARFGEWLDLIAASNSGADLLQGAAGADLPSSAPGAQPLSVSDAVVSLVMLDFTQEDVPDAVYIDAEYGVCVYDHAAGGRRVGVPPPPPPLCLLPGQPEEEPASAPDPLYMGYPHGEPENEDELFSVYL